MKVVNSLLGYNNFKIVQDTDFFSFSLDSVLLSRFVQIKKGVENILDIGTGNAPIPIILSTITDANIYGIEIQKEIYDMAKESIKLNNLENRITLINDDVNNLKNHFKQGYFDIIVSNPPYFKICDKSKKNLFEQKTIARHEVCLSLNSLIEISSKFLRNGGTFAMVHRTERLSEILKIMENNNIAPKRIQFVYSKITSNSNMVLIEGKKGGNIGVKILPPLVSHNIDGSYRKEVERFFE